jgi:hypothetical protein
VSWAVHLPIVGLFSIQYWGAPVCFAFPILLAHGTDALDSRTAGRWPAILVLLAAGGWSGFLLWRLGVPQSEAARLDLTVLAVLAAAGLAALVALRARPRARPVVIAVLGVLAVGELIFDLNRMRPERREPDFSAVGFVRYLRDHGDGGRVLNIGGRGLYPNWGSALEIPQVGSLDGLSLAWYDELFDRRFGKTDTFLAIRSRRSQDPPEKVATLDLAALDLLGVRHVVVASEMQSHLQYLRASGLRVVLQDHGVFVLANPTALPRAFAAASVVEGPGLPSDLGLSPRAAVTTTDAELLRRAEELGIAGARAPRFRKLDERPTSVAITASGHARVEIQATLNEAAVVVLADTWHPDWKATVGGDPVPVARVDEVLRGIALPAGEHHVVLEYTPRTLPAALLVSAITIGALTGWWLWRRRQPRDRREGAT